MLPIRDSLQIKGHTETESEGMEKDDPCKWEQKESWCSYAYPRQNKLLEKTVVKDKKRHHIMIKRPIQQKDTTVVNIYALNIGASKYIK